MKKHILILLLIGISVGYAQDTLSSGRLVFKIEHSDKPATYDTIWYAPGVFRSQWGLNDYRKMLNYSREGKDTVVTTKKDYEKFMKLQLKIKNVKTVFKDHDTLTIAGILCQMAIVTVIKQNDSIEEYSVYYSPRIGGKHCNFTSFFEEIPGIPLSVSGKSVEKKDCLFEYAPLNSKDIYIPDFYQTGMHQRMMKDFREKQKGKKA
jgi:hypothetical protein